MPHIIYGYGKNGGAGVLFSELCRKEVVSVTTGKKLGNVDDVEFDAQGARIRRLFIYGRGFLFGSFGRDEDIVIDWESIKTIGSDIILIEEGAELKKDENSVRKHL